VFHCECKLNYDRSYPLLKNTEEKVPFRLSDNIKEFICPVGQAGILPVVMTCCSLAAEQKDDYIRSFLRIFFSEEDIQPYKNSEEAISNIVEDVMNRIHSFFNPYLRTIDEANKAKAASQGDSKPDASASVTTTLLKNKSQLRYLADENKDEIETLVRLSKLSIEDERFNKVAYDLVEEASNKQVLMDMDLNFASWF